MLLVGVDVGAAGGRARAVLDAVGLIVDRSLLVESGRKTNLHSIKDVAVVVVVVVVSLLSSTKMDEA